jgi:uncharacterized membrane protein YgcG
VLDEIGFFTEAQEAQITASFAATAELYGILPVVEVVQNLGGEEPETYAIRRANELGVGTAEANNGLYVMFSLDERSLRVEPGIGLTETIDPGEIQSVVDDVMIPAFTANNHTNGVISGVDVLASYSTVEGSSSSSSSMELKAIGGFLALFLGSIIAVVAVILWFERRIERKKKAKEARVLDLEEKVTAFEKKLAGTPELSDRFTKALTRHERFAELDANFGYTAFASDDEKKATYERIESNFAKEHVEYSGIPAKFYTETLQEQESIRRYSERLVREKPKAEEAQAEDQRRIERQAEAKVNWGKLSGEDQEAYALAEDRARTGSELIDDYNDPDKAETYSALADVRKAELEYTARSNFDKLSSEAKAEIAQADESEREQQLRRYVPSYTSMMLPVYFTAINAHNSAAQAAALAASQASTRSYSSSSTYSGGGFRGGGGGGSW